MVIKPGLIIRAKCNNRRCLCYGKFVCINQGFGEFNLGKYFNRNICPLCKLATEKAQFFGYYNANISIEAVDDITGK